MKQHPSGKTMSMIGFSKYGKPSQLKKTNVAYPHGFEASNNIVIKVHASAINPVDKAHISGDLKLVRPIESFPHIICYDVAGVVEEADLEGKFSIGQPVFARLFGNEGDGKKTPWYRGAMAEYCVADTANVVMKPDNLTFEEAASIPLVGMTAFQALKSSGLKEGDRIFISGGAGGVGTMAIQLAKNVFNAGLVVTTASKGEKENLCRSLGADVVIDASGLSGYDNSELNEFYGGSNDGKFEVCFDTTAESHEMSNIVKEGGSIITIAGMPTLEEIRRIGGTAWILKLFLKRRERRKEFKSAKSVGANWDYLFLSPSNEDLSTLAGHLESGAIKPVLDGIWSFHSEDSEEGWKGAFNRSFSGRSKGKCVVQFSS